MTYLRFQFASIRAIRGQKKRFSLSANSANSRELPMTNDAQANDARSANDYMDINLEVQQGEVLGIPLRNDRPGKHNWIVNIQSPI